MDMVLAAGVISMASVGDLRRFDGTPMLSALPCAPLVPERPALPRRIIARLTHPTQRSAIGRA